MDGRRVPVQRTPEPLGGGCSRPGHLRRAGPRRALPVRGGPVRDPRPDGPREADPAPDEHLLVGRRPERIRVLRPSRGGRGAHPADVEHQGRGPDQHQGPQGQVPAPARRQEVPLRRVRDGPRAVHQHDRDAARPKRGARHRPPPRRELRLRPRVARGAHRARQRRQLSAALRRDGVATAGQPGVDRLHGAGRDDPVGPARRARIDCRQHDDVPVRQPRDGERGRGARRRTAVRAGAGAQGALLAEGARAPMSERTSYYVTTAIFYPSERPALHSMFEAIGADAIARYHRLLGHETRFLTGMDEHSANVERDARELGIDPHALIDPWAATWQATFERFGISADRCIRTTDPDHAVASIEMVRRAQAAGDVYKGLYSGWFCTGCNEFKTDQQLVNGRCPDHPTLEPQWLEEHNYFFRLSAYQERLEQLYAENPSFCEPEHFRNEVLGWLRDGLRDFSISRSGTTWGIPFPGAEGHRIYVWFDALTNYLTGAGFPNDQAEMDRWWPADLHVIGKNITRFHCLYWPAMLMSAGLPLPKQIFAHGFMLDISGQRMSKTTGNTEDPDEMADTFGVDGVRYVVLREVPFERDADVTLDGFVRRYNADLANDLGNLVNRTVSMSNRYLEGKLPPVSD